jgi:hypothetical protein
MRELFDLFQNDENSVLQGLLSPSKQSRGKLSRVTVNAALKPLLRILKGSPPENAFETLNNYFTAFHGGLMEIGLDDMIINATVFRAVAGFFPNVAQRVKDNFGSDYSADNFYEIMRGLFPSISQARIKSPGNSYKSLIDHFEKQSVSAFSL